MRASGVKHVLTLNCQASPETKHKPPGQAGDSFLYECKHVLTLNCQASPETKHKPPGQACDSFLYEFKGAAFGRAGAGCGRPQAAVLAGATTAMAVLGPS